MTPPLRPVPSIPASLTGTRQAMSMVLASQVGYREGSNNDNAYGAWYPMNHAAWCAMFQSWGAYRAGIPTSVIPKHSYTPAGRDWFAARGRLHSTPEAGDIGYVYFSSLHRVGHVFYVDSTYRTASGVLIMRTIEGNTNDNGSSSGIGVFRLLRADTTNLSYGRPAYRSGGTAAAPPPPAAEDDLMSDAQYKALDAKLDRILRSFGVGPGQTTSAGTQAATLADVQKGNAANRTGFASMGADMAGFDDALTAVAALDVIRFRLDQTNAQWITVPTGRAWISAQDIVTLDLARTPLVSVPAGHFLWSLPTVGPTPPAA